MKELILVETREPGIVFLTLNRPERRNALNLELLDRLSVQLKRLEGDPSHRVVILCGAGPDFSAGLDLHEAADLELVERLAESVGSTLNLLRETSLVVIAAVQGGAYAGGAGLMAACDFVIASSDATIGFPEARRGLLPALICDVLRTRVLDANLRDLFLSGDPIDVDRAREIGLVQRVASREALLDEAVNAGRSVLAGGPDTIRQTKALLNDAFRCASPSAASLMQQHLSARHSEEAREGLAAFAEKREPNWK